MAFNKGGEVLLLRGGCFFLLERIVDTRISVIKTFVVDFFTLQNKSMLCLGLCFSTKDSVSNYFTWCPEEFKWIKISHQFVCCKWCILGSDAFLCKILMGVKVHIFQSPLI